MYITSMLTIATAKQLLLSKSYFSDEGDGQSCASTGHSNYLSCDNLVFHLR